MGILGINRWQNDWETVPDEGATIFDFFGNPLVAGSRLNITHDYFAGQRSVLLITTSLGAHFHLAKHEDSFFIKIRDRKLGRTGFGAYEYIHLVPSGMKIVQISIAGWALRYGKGNVLP
jgi:hypothetical protein